jgi:hypothetical protein
MKDYLNTKQYENKIVIMFISLTGILSPVFSKGKCEIECRYI